jgi:hypothetical protein
MKERSQERDNLLKMAKYDRLVVSEVVDRLYVLGFNVKSR